MLRLKIEKDSSGSSKVTLEGEDFNIHVHSPEMDLSDLEQSEGSVSFTAENLEFDGVAEIKPERIAELGHTPNETAGVYVHGCPAGHTHLIVGVGTDQVEVEVITKTSQVMKAGDEPEDDSSTLGGLESLAKLALISRFMGGISRGFERDPETDSADSSSK